MTRFTLPMVFIALLIASGCETRTSPPSTAATSAKPVTRASSSTTIERVRKVVSEQMGVALANVTPKTSLGDLAADELDFVELIMELEESFSITISDDKAEALTGNQDWQKGMNIVTIEKLSELVTDLSKQSANQAIDRSRRPAVFQMDDRSRRPRSSQMFE